jgi:adenylate cyclase
VEIFVIGFLSLRLFIDSDYIVSIVSPMVAVVGGYVASTTYHFVSERRQRLMIKMMFSTYVSPSVVDELISHPEKLRLGGERKELSVLFSDLEGFTTLAETTPPDELVGILNEYLTAMTQVIMKNNGTLDKFEGDLIMAFWGAPIPQNDHVFRACMAALQMQSALATIRQEWPLKNKPALFARIGINTGEMVVGNMGSTEKFNYTVIGDSVNIASRLEGANKIYKTGIILSESSYNQVRVAFRFRELDLLAVKGRTEPIRIYELLGTVRDPLSSTEEQFLLCYLDALQAYKESRWRDSRQRFADALRIKPSDFPSRLYIERVEYFMSNPPPAGWNGVFAMVRKQVSTEESPGTPLARMIDP